MLEIAPDIAQSTHGNRNIFADIRNVPTRPHTVLGMFLLAFSVTFGLVASRDIPPFTEILVNYGASYLYPTHYEE
jgi:hypothetical protein